MERKIFTRLMLLVSLIFCGVDSITVAQDLTPWTNNPYGNEWIDYGKKYVRVGVPKDGFYKILLSDLPSDLRDPQKLQIFYRGKEIAISVNSSEVVFFGRKNDGVGESLLYRPGPEARTNPYQNILSDLGYYFITLSTSGTPKRIGSATGGSTTGDAETYHMQKDIVALREFFSFTTMGFDQSLNPSFYTSGNSWGSSYIYGVGVGVPTKEFRDLDVKLKNWVQLENLKPKIEVMINGLGMGQHQANVYMGNTAQNREANKIFAFPQFYGFDSQKMTRELNYPDHLNSNGEGYMRVRTSTNDYYDYIGLSYYTITYPQTLDMGGSTILNSAIFNFTSTGSGSRFIKVKNAPVNSMVYDITDPSSPLLVSSTRNGNDLDLAVQRSDNNDFKLMVLAPSEVTTILPSNINTLNFKATYANNNGDLTISPLVDPSAYDYIIISHDINKTNGQKYPEYVDAGINYAKYRSSVEGGNFKTVLFNIRDIYDQFNFGEPSPIAIHRFMKYMLKAGIRPKHNLLLIGHSITYSANIKKELIGEVPTFGDPSSDNLLVTGLQATPNFDVPAIPVGRINAYTHTEINNYLTKVKLYESESNPTWRRNIQQIVGGHSSNEVNTFKGYFENVNSQYVNRVLQRNIYSIKDNGGSNASQSVDEETIGRINSGVGLISYFGHGNHVAVALTIGEILKTTAPTYTANSRFPVLYFLGCGVGNNSFDPTKQFFAANWLTAAPDRGAIAVLSNTALTWIPQAEDHLKKLYEEIFTVNDSQRPTIGQILNKIAARTINGSASGRTLAADATTTSMIHQMSLMGDPALTILKSNDGSLPVSLVNFKAQLFQSNMIRLDWETAWEKNNSHFVIERSYNGKDFVAIGRVEGNNTSSSKNNYDFIDAKPGAGINYYRLRTVDFGADSLNKSYSNIISLKMPDTDQIIIHPNPFRDKFTITLNIPATLSSWKLINMEGVVRKEGNGSSPSIVNLAPGNYILEVYTSKGDVYRRKVVQR